MSKEFLTLNPAYILRQDGNRVILCGDESSDDKSEDWFSFIHPYYAMLLSFFSENGTSANEKIDKSANYFNKTREYITNLITPLTDNPHRRTIFNKRGALYFPKNTLISSSEPLFRQKEYQSTEFKYKGLPDLSSNRLEYPLNINLELTMRCYTDCIYCYANRQLPKIPSLTTARILELIQEAKDNNVKNFDINGGEVWLHKDIRPILEKLLTCGFNPLVSTKIPLTHSDLDYLRDIGLKKLQISLDSADDIALGKLLGTPLGYLDKIKDTLAYASKIGLKININTVLTKYNSSVEGVHQLLSLTASYPCVQTHRLNPTGFSLYKDNFDEIRASRQSIEQLEQRLSQWKEEFDINITLAYYECENFFNPSYKQSKFKNRAICTGNVWNMVILPNGDVTICEELYSNKRFIIGSVVKNSIREVWNSEEALNLYNLTLQSSTESNCKDCNEFRACRTGQGVCWKTILMAYGDNNWDFPDPRCPKAPFPYNKFFY